jgi:hypothetical protein
VHPIYLFVLITINIISININSHPFLITGKLELHVVYTAVVIHVTADVNKDPSVEQKTQNFSHNFLQHFCIQAHSACALYLQYLRSCLYSQSFNTPLEREIESLCYW